MIRNINYFNKIYTSEAVAELKLLKLNSLLVLLKTVDIILNKIYFKNIKFF